MTCRLLAVVLAVGVVLAGCTSGSEGPDDRDGGGSWGWDDASSGPDDGTDGESESGDSEDVELVPPTGTPADPTQYPDAYTGHAFSSPTGNIVCWIDADADQWGCLVKQRTYEEPAGDDACLAQFGQGFSSVQGGVLTPLCRGGVIAEAEVSGGTVLPYGSTLTVGSVTCGSAETGVTCADQRSGRILFISRASYALA